MSTRRNSASTALLATLAFFATDRPASACSCRGQTPDVYPHTGTHAAPNTHIRVLMPYGPIDSSVPLALRDSAGRSVAFDAHPVALGYRRQWVEFTPLVPLRVGEHYTFGAVEPPESSDSPRRRREWGYSMDFEQTQLGVRTEFQVDERMDATPPEWAGPFAVYSYGAPLHFSGASCGTGLPWAHVAIEPARDDVTPDDEILFALWVAEGGATPDLSATPTSVQRPYQGSLSSGGGSMCSPVVFPPPEPGQSIRLAIRAMDRTGRMGPVREMSATGALNEATALERTERQAPLDPTGVSRRVTTLRSRAAVLVFAAFLLFVLSRIAVRRPARRRLVTGLGAGVLALCVTIAGVLLRFESQCLANEARACTILGRPMPGFHAVAGQQRAMAAWRAARANARNAVELRTEAKRAYQAGCEAGDGDSCTQLARVLYYGVGGRVVRDQRAAFVYSQRACSLGSEEGCADAAHAWANGRGVQRNVARARQLAVRSCDRGVGRGCAVAGDLARIERQRVRSNEWFERGCRLGSSEGCVGAHNPYARHADFTRDEAGVRAQDDRIASLRRIECEAGLLDQCLAWTHLRVTRTRVRSASDEQVCALGYQEACVAFAQRRIYATPTRDGEYGSQRVDLEDRFATACLLGFANGCDVFAQGVPNWENSRWISSMAIALRRADCGRGDGLACVALTNGQLDDPEDRNAIGRRACELGVGEACTRFLNGAPRESVRRGCELGSSEACVSDIVWQRSPSSMHEIAPMLVPLCDRGEMQSCRYLAQAYEDRNGPMFSIHDADRMLARECATNPRCRRSPEMDLRSQ